MSVQVEDVAHVGDLLGLLDRCAVGTFVNWGFYRPHVWQNSPHLHSFSEVCLAYSGTGTFRYDGGEHHVPTGAAFLARPGVVHQVLADPDQPLGICFWSFTPAVQEAWGTGLQEGPVVTTETGALGDLLRALSAEARTARQGRAAVLEGLGAALLVESARVFAAPGAVDAEDARPGRTSQVVAAMRQYLLDNLAGDLLVADVAAAAHLSERHAQRVFAAETGESLMAALRRLRMERAAVLLRETSQPVAAVGRACGYTDEDAFAAAFRRAHGQPPRRFRASGGTLHLG